jgi:hypothetical protein
MWCIPDDIQTVARRNLQNLQMLTHVARLGCGYFRQQTLIFSEIQNANPSGPDLDGIEVRNKSKSQKSKPYISEEDIPNMNSHIVKWCSFENLFFEH